MTDLDPAAGRPDPTCLFCRIVAGEVPATVVYETADVVAFRDINPQAPTHVLVVPRAHHPDAGSLGVAAPALAGAVLAAAAEVARRDGVGAAHRIVFNTGAGAGQSVFHVHAHVVGGRPLGWPPFPPA